MRCGVTGGWRRVGGAAGVSLRVPPCSPCQGRRAARIARLRLVLRIPDRAATRWWQGGLHSGFWLRKDLSMNTDERFLETIAMVAPLLRRIERQDRSLASQARRALQSAALLSKPIRSAAAKTTNDEDPWSVLRHNMLLRVHQSLVNAVCHISNPAQHFSDEAESLSPSCVSRPRTLVEQERFWPLRIDVLRACIEHRATLIKKSTNS